MGDNLWLSLRVSVTASLELPANAAYYHSIYLFVRYFMLLGVIYTLAIRFHSIYWLMTEPTGPPLPTAFFVL